VVVLDLCELQSGEILFGDSGFDTLQIPVPLAQVQARGVLVAGFEAYVVEPHGCMSECTTKPVCSEHGSCAEQPDGALGCACEPGWSGADCSVCVGAECGAGDSTTSGGESTSSESTTTTGVASSTGGSTGGTESSSTGTGTSTSAGAETGGDACSPDALEENDEPTNATPVSSSGQTFSDLTASEAEYDLFRVSVCAGGRLSIDASFLHGSADLDVLVQTEAGALVGASTSITDNEHALVVNSGATETTYLVGMYVVGLQPELQCTAYDLDIVVDQCGTAQPPTPSCGTTTFEADDVPFQAMPIATGDGAQNDVALSGTDKDWYAFDVCAGCTLTVTASFDPNAGNIDLYAQDLENPFFINSTGTTGSETIEVSNPGGTAATIKLFAALADALANACTQYDLMWSTSGDTGESTGSTGGADTAGSASASASASGSATDTATAGDTTGVTTTGATTGPVTTSGTEADTATSTDTGTGAGTETGTATATETQTGTEAGTDTGTDTTGDTGLPPDPSLVAPPLDPTVVTKTYEAVSFLFEGDNPIQEGVAPGTIEPLRVAVLRGQVLDRNGAPVPGVTVSIHGHAELGTTKTRADGRYDIAVNGGGAHTLDFRPSTTFRCSARSTCLGRNSSSSTP